MDSHAVFSLKDSWVMAVIIPSLHTGLEAAPWWSSWIIWHPLTLQEISPVGISLQWFAFIWKYYKTPGQLLCYWESHLLKRVIYLCCKDRNKKNQTSITGICWEKPPGQEFSHSRTNNGPKALWEKRRAEETIIVHCFVPGQLLGWVQRGSGWISQMGHLHSSLTEYKYGTNKCTNKINK